MPQTQPPKAPVSAVRFVGALFLLIGAAQVYWGDRWYIDGIPERWIGTFVLGLGGLMEIAPELFRRRVGRIYQKAEELTKGSPSNPS